MEQWADLKDKARETWAKGSYDVLGGNLLPAVAHLVRLAGVQRGERVLDVACGTGNTAITTRLAGAEVVGLDLTPELTEMLRKHHPLFVITHFNHPKEISPEARAACEALVDAGVPVENQAVLMRRLNSTPRAITELCHRLLRMRVRP